MLAERYHLIYSTSEGSESQMANYLEMLFLVVKLCKIILNKIYRSFVA